MSLRPTRRTHHQEESVHLNITPYLDILVSLILFLLSSAAFLKLSVVDTNLPKLVEASDIQPEDKLVVTLRITDSGFEVGRVGQDGNPSLQRRWAAGDLAGHIPRGKDGQYRFDLLNNQMARIKQVYPNAVSIMFLPSGDVNYENLVHSMDATREVQVEGESAQESLRRRKEFLFPDAIIGHVAESEGGG